jgi:hypothetical protein
MAAADDTEDYATWVDNSAGCHLELKDPQELEELDTMVPTAYYDEGWSLTTKDNRSKLGLGENLRDRARSAWEVTSTSSSRIRVGSGCPPAMRFSTRTGASHRARAE